MKGGGEWFTSLPCRFTPGERAPDTHCIGDWVGPRAWSRRCGIQKNVLTVVGIGPRPSNP
jgi:hypothetical protein